MLKTIRFIGSLIAILAKIILVKKVFELDKCMFRNDENIISNIFVTSVVFDDYSGSEIRDIPK